MGTSSLGAWSTLEALQELIKKVCTSGDTQIPAGATAQLSQQFIQHLQTGWRKQSATDPRSQSHKLLEQLSCSIVHLEAHVEVITALQCELHVTVESINRLLVLIATLTHLCQIVSV